MRAGRDADRGPSSELRPGRGVVRALVLGDRSSASWAQRRVPELIWKIWVDSVAAEVSSWAPWSDEKAEGPSLQFLLSSDAVPVSAYS